jgi:histidyl-tRNA synthetase
MYTWQDGERFDEAALTSEWIARGTDEDRFYVESAAPLNGYLGPLRILFINDKPHDQPEFVCFRQKATAEAVDLLLKTRSELKSQEFSRRYPQFTDVDYLRRFEIKLRIVVPAGTGDSVPSIDTRGVQVEQFQNKTPVFKSSQSLTLRPENTAGVVRAYIERQLERTGIVQKLFYIGPQFRRERPQKGRYRQFYQIGAEVIGPTSAGSESPARDAEVLEMLATLLDRLGIQGWTLELNSVGCANDRAVYLEALREALKPVVGQMCTDCQRRAETNPMRVLDCKHPEDQAIIERLPRISQYLDESCKQHFEDVKSILTACGVPFTLNDRLVRGLDYYTRTAFEFTHGALGAQNAILGGGRYDGLSEAIGGPKAPGIGFAIGEDRLVMSIPESAASIARPPDAYIAPMGAGMNRDAAQLARELRRNDLVIELGDETFRLKKSLETASKLGARFAIILGENEAKSSQFAVKDLTKGEQVTVPREELAQTLKRNS